METIVIVGGGAGGLELATRLGDTLGARKRARVLLVDRYPSHFWKPLLHTVAAGKCDPRVEQLSFSAQALEHHFEFVQGVVASLDTAAQTITLAPRSGAGNEEAARSLAYDKLVLALGSVTNFYNVPGAAEHALTLDNVNDAETFHRRFMDACVRAGEQQAQVDVVIVGAGATGVELAAELSNSARALAAYKVHSLDPQRDIRIRILERGARMLPQLHPQQSARTASQLAQLGIEAHTGTAVAGVTASSVIDASGVAHRADLTLWAAGVEAPAVCSTLGLATNHLRQIVVNASLRSVSDPHVYALGDCASYVCPRQGAAPPRAQVAHQQAMFLADLLARRPQTPGPDFRYHDYGSLVSLGPRAAIGMLTGALTGKTIRVGGSMGSLLYRLLYQKHLFNLHGALRVAVLALADWLRARILPPVKLY